jgi:hypothetical protein
MDTTGSPGIPPADEDAAPAPVSPPPEPPPPAAAPPAPAATGWVSAITSQQTLTGAAGLVYADIPARIIAYIIDAIILSVGFFILLTLFGALFFTSVVGGFGFMAFVWLVVLVFIYAAGSAVYFIYTWTKLRGSPGQRILGLETLNASDGAVLTQPQAIRRWLFLFGPWVVASVLSLTPFLGGVGSLLGILIWAYVIYLLYTTAQSATRQGFHDVQASSVVVKVAR